MGYAPNRIAGSLAAATSNLIAISVPTLFDAVFAEIVDGMREPLMRAGLETMIETSDYDPSREEAWVERMLAWSPAAIVVTGVDRSEAVRDRLRNAPFPVVELWDAAESPIDLNIGVDHYQAGYAMGRHLVRLGYRRPAYVGVMAGRDPRAEKRRKGVLDAFMTVDAPFVDEVRINNAPSFKAGFDGAMAVITGSQSPDLIYLLNDHLAFGGMAACAEAGKLVPDDIGIVGFNDLGINAVLARTLTTSRTPRAQMGLSAARLVVSRIGVPEFEYRHAGRSDCRSNDPLLQPEFPDDVCFPDDGSQI